MSIMDVREEVQSVSDDFSVFDRRMKILGILKNQRRISRLELARRFSVSDDAIGRDVTALSRFVPISSSMGRNGGIYIIDEYDTTKTYLSRDEENLLKELVPTLSGKKKLILETILYKFSIPKAK